MNTKQASDRAGEILRNTDHYVRENPVPVILGAVAVGFVIGLAVRSLDHDRKAAPIHEREKVLQRRLWSLLDNGAIPPREEVLRGVLPRLREPVYHAVLERQLAAQVDDEAERALLQIPYRHLNDELEVNAVFDLPTSAMDVTAARLTGWNMSLAELEQHALANLKLRSREPFRLIAAGLWASPWGDGHDAARMLLTEEIARLEVKGEHVAMIPEEAVLQRADGAIAYRVVAGNRAERRNIKLGVIREGRVEVIDGLAIGDQVVVRGQAQLVDGSPVTLRDAKGAPAGAATGVSAGVEKTAAAEAKQP